MITLTLASTFAFISFPSSASGVESSIKYLFVVELSHLDIGYTDTPDAVEEFYKLNIDHAIALCKADPDYKWTIEEIWQLEQWLKRSTSSEIDELVSLVKAGRIGLTAGYANMHSGVLGDEEINRFLYPAKQIATAWNISIETIIQDDVPGYSWALPQVLNKSNVKYMATGINTWIFGKPAIPISDNPFYWQGPDGSKVLTWISFDAYTEGFNTYGLTDITNAYNKLSTKLPQLESQGYPYDAVLVLRGADNWDTSSTMTNLARLWNDTYDNPKIVLAHPEDFFKYMESKYAGQFPTYSGDWASWWDILGMTQPQSVAKNRWAHDNILSAEKLSTINDLLGLQAYPANDIELAYQKMMEFDEHSTGGSPWPGYMTPEESQRQNEIYCGYATTAYETTANVLQTGLEALAGDVKSNKPSIIVFNPLSWNRTDVVRIKLSDGLFSRTFDLVDSETGLPVVYQKLEETKEIMFVAENVPPIGYKKFEINFSQPSTPSSSVYVSGNIIGNQFYEITLDNADGHITSVYDKEAGRELVNQASEFGFNEAIKASNQQVWLGGYDVVPTGASAITIGMNGSVAKSLIVNRRNSPHVKTEVILYNDIKRVDLVNTMNRTLMAHVSYSTNFVWYAYTFPFNLTSFDVKFEIANTFMTPEVDNLPGANTAYFPTQHGLEIFEANYGVTWASKETFCHEFDGMNLYSTTFSPSEATLVSRWIKKEDEGEFVGGSIGPVVQEPGASPILVQTYSFETHSGSFDPVNTTHSIWAYSNPLLAKETWPNPNGFLASPSLSFFSVNSSNIMLLNMKKADFGDDYIFRLLELEGKQTAARLDSAFFNVEQANLTNIVEDNIGGLPVEEGGVIVSIGPFETLTMRVKIQPRFARFSVVSLSELHLKADLHLLNGTSLKVFFYNYTGAYAANVTVWNGSTPMQVVISANVTHPLGEGVKNATLVLTDNGGNVISSIASFVMYRSNLMQRLVTMDLDWPYASPEQQGAMAVEYSDIDKQWAHAPP